MTEESTRWSILSHIQMHFHKYVYGSNAFVLECVHVCVSAKKSLTLHISTCIARCVCERLCVSVVKKITLHCAVSTCPHCKSTLWSVTRSEKRDLYMSVHDWARISFNFYRLVHQMLTNMKLRSIDG